jgi:hypothetical protein
MERTNGDTNVIKDLIDGMTEEVIIANTGYGTWRLVVERHKFQLVHQPVLVALVLGLYFNRHSRYLSA